MCDDNKTEGGCCRQDRGRRGGRKRSELLGLLRLCFARVEPWLQAGKYVSAVASDLPARNGWTIAQQAGDRVPQRTQRLLNRAVWDTFAAMGVVRRFAVAGLEEAACRAGRRRGLRVGAIDETSQVKQGCATAGVKRHYLGCVGKVANGITTVHLSYVRERTGHALIGARQWIPAEQITGPVTSLVMGLPLDLVFRTKGQLAIDILTETLTGGVRLDFVCGDEVYGACTELREFCEDYGQGYVLRVPSSFHLTLARGITTTCAQAVTRLLTDPAPLGGTLRRARVQGAALVCVGAAGHCLAARHHLLIRRHLASGELAFHYYFVPQGQCVSMARLIRAAGLRWPVEEDFEFGKDCFGLDQSQVRLYTAIARHTVLVMAALAICAVTAALLRHRTDTQAPPPATPDQPPPPDPGMVPLTVQQVKHLLAARPTRHPPGHADRWLDWKRRHQARSRWYHQRARLARGTEIAPASQYRLPPSCGSGTRTGPGLLLPETMAPMASITVQRVDFGYFVRPAEETGTGAPRVEPCLGYVVGHPAGPLLFDTGMGSHPEVDAHYRPRRAELEQALTATGVTIADLRLAANSHLHFDHCGGNPKLAQLPVFVQAAELRTARQTPDYTLPELIDRSRFEQVTGPAEVLPGVTLMPTPGHTAGHQSLVVHRPDGVVIVAGQSHDTATQYAADQLSWHAHHDGHGQPLPDIPAWIDTLQQLDPRMVYFAHDRCVWTP